MRAARTWTAAAMAAGIALAGAAHAQPPARPVIYEMDSLRTGALSPEILKQMEPLHSLQAVEDLLKANLLPFAWAHGQVSASTLPPQLAQQIEALPPGEVFIVKQGEGWVMSVVVSKH